MDSIMKSPITLSEITLSKNEESNKISLSFTHDFDHNIAGFLLNIEIIKEDEEGNELFDSKQEKKIGFFKKGVEHHLEVELPKNAVGGRVYLSNIILENGGRLSKTRELKFEDPEWVERQKEKEVKALEMQAQELQAQEAEAKEANEIEVVEEPVNTEKDKILLGLVIANGIMGLIGVVLSLLFIYLLKTPLKFMEAIEYGFGLKTVEIYPATILIICFILTILTSIRNLMKTNKVTGIYSLIYAILLLVVGLVFNPIGSLVGLVGLSFSHYLMERKVKLTKYRGVFGVSLFATAFIYLFLCFMVIGLSSSDNILYYFVSVDQAVVFALLTALISVIVLLGIHINKKLSVASFILLMCHRIFSFGYSIIANASGGRTGTGISFLLSIITAALLLLSLIFALITLAMNKAATIIMSITLGLMLITPYVGFIAAGLSSGRSNQPENQPADQTIPASDIADLEIQTYNTKTQFNVGDTFTCQGLVVIAWLKDGSKITLNPSSYVVYVPDMSTAGQKQVKVKYNTFEKYYVINVVQSGEQVQITEPSLIVGKSIADFLADTEGNGKKLYELTGKITRWGKAGINHSGSFYISDDLGQTELYIAYSSADPSTLKWNNILGEYNFYDHYDFLNNEVTKYIKIDDTVTVRVFDSDYFPNYVNATGLIIAVNPAEPSNYINRIELDVSHAQRVFALNEGFNCDGLVVTAFYNDGFHEEVNEYDISVDNMDTGGVKDVIVSYYGESVSYEIYVEDRTVKSIYLIASDCQTIFDVGDEFNYNGLRVYILYNDGDWEQVFYYTITQFPDMSTPGQYLVIVKYTWVETSYCVDVIQQTERLLSYISLDTSKVQTVFTLDEDFNSDGLVVTAYYDDGFHREVFDYSVTVYDDTSKQGRTEVEVEYLNLYAYYWIDVYWFVNEDDVYLSYIDLDLSNVQTVFAYDENFKYDGLVVTACYSDGSRTEVFDYEIEEETSMFFSNEYRLVYVIYNEICWATYVVYHPISNSLPENPTNSFLVYLRINTYNAELSFESLDSFSDDGLVITGYYNDGTTKELTYGSDSAMDCRILIDYEYYSNLGIAYIVYNFDDNTEICYTTYHFYTSDYDVANH